MERVKHRFLTWSPNTLYSAHLWSLVLGGKELSIRRLGSGDAWLCVGAQGVLRLGLWG